MNSKHSFRTFVLFAMTVLVGGDYELRAQFRDSFEGGNPRWLLWRSDAQSKLVGQQPSSTMPHTGLLCEQLELTSGHGTYAYLVYPIQRTAIIDELRTSLWVRSASDGIRIGFRVVFPWTAHPTTGNQLTLVIWGSSGEGGGRWSNVSLGQPREEFTRQLPLLRSEYGPGVDLREAYIDAVVLNVYSGPGAAKLQIDDLTIESMVDLPAAPAPPSDTSLMAGLPESGESLQLEMAQRLHDLRREVPRWLQYQGESLPWLRTLGINGLVLDAPRDATWLNEAQSLGIQILTPPPMVTPPVEEWAAYASVHGWLLGSALDTSHMNASRELSQRLSQFPTRLLRPTIVESMENHWAFARIADVLAVPAPISTTIESGRELTQLLRSSYSMTRGRTLPITSLALQPSSEWTEQQRGIISALGTPQSTIPEFDLLQARLRMYQSVAAGARGWYFRSQTPLDSGEESDRLRAAYLKAICAELEWLGPWLQSATDPVELTTQSPSSYQVSVHSSPNADLIVMIAGGIHDTYCSVAPESQPIEVPLTNQPSGTQAFRISHGRLQPIVLQKGPHQYSARIERPGFVELIVVTREDRVISYLQQRSADAARAIWDSQNEIASQLLRLVQLSAVAERVDAPNSPTWSRIREAESLARRSEYLLQRNDLSSAIDAAEQCSMICQRLIRESWERAILQVGSPHASPWVESQLGLPMHWQVLRAVGQRPWQALDVPGAAATQWEAMVERGWKVDQRIADQVDSQVHVVPSSGADGGPTLHLSAYSVNGQSIPGGFAGSSMRVSSPTIATPFRCLVRIEGFVRSIRSPSDLQSGLLVYDDTAGPGSGQLYRSGNPNEAWQRISLYRFVSGESGIRIMMELRGEGEFLVDDLRVSTILPSLAPQFPVTPYDSTSAVSSR